MIEKSEAYTESVRALIEDKTITELKEILDGLNGIYDEDDKADFINEFEYHRELNDVELIEAVKEAIRNKIEECEPETIAVAEYFECEPDELKEESYDHYGLKVFSYGGMEAAVGTEEEVDAAATEEIKSSLWAFTASFISWHTKNGLSDRAEKALEKMQGELCESANDIIEAMIEDLDKFVDDAINIDGRGHFLSSYDGAEFEEKVDGEWYYIYRIN